MHRPLDPLRSWGGDTSQGSKELFVRTGCPAISTIGFQRLAQSGAKHWGRKELPPTAGWRTPTARILFVQRAGRCGFVTKDIASCSAQRKREKKEERKILLRVRCIADAQTPTLTPQQASRPGPSAGMVLALALVSIRLSPEKKVLWPAESFLDGGVTRACSSRASRND